jgi:hypothetical protein
MLLERALLRTGQKSDNMTGLIYGDVITSDLLVGEWRVEQLYQTRPMVHVFRAAPMGLSIDAQIPIENVLTVNGEPAILEL